MNSEINIAELIGYTFQRDETSIVLKAHLFLEQNLDQVLIKWVKNPEIILKNTFRNKVDFLYSVGIITKDFQSKLLVINKIRNKFSHTYKYQLSEEDLLELSRLGGIHVNETDKEYMFPAAKEGVLFVSATAMLIQALLYLNDASNDVAREILQNAIDEVHKKRSSRVSKKDTQQ